MLKNLTQEQFQALRRSRAGLAVLFLEQAIADCLPGRYSSTRDDGGPTLTIQPLEPCDGDFRYAFIHTLECLVDTETTLQTVTRESVAVRVEFRRDDRWKASTTQVPGGVITRHAVGFDLHTATVLLACDVLSREPFAGWEWRDCEYNSRRKLLLSNGRAITEMWRCEGLPAQWMTGDNSVRGARATVANATLECAQRVLHVEHQKRICARIPNGIPRVSLSAAA